ncbi:MAG: DUF3737 family protein [Bacteroidales bacterium]|nr:DUF3737 family protein [Bacteroidales bacterium]
MERIINTEFGGERPLYHTQDLYLENVTIHVGESALKETKNIEAVKCRFEGKYPFWETYGFKVKDCLFTEGARAALWYSTDLVMEDTIIEAPKMFREMQRLKLKNVKIPSAQETLWHCKDIELENVETNKADYIFMHCENIKINNYKQNGNYSFQYCKNVEIHNAILNTKDAFWNTENVTVYDSEINGEYLAWYSKNLRLVNCKITQTQPLCYAENLILENCSFGEDADLAFEYSTVQATINGKVTSVKNPMSGRILADGYGEIILDENIKKPGDCQILTR